MNTPTPNKDEVNLDNFPLNEALRFADENSTTGGLVTQAALKTLAAGCRELTAAREELAELKEEYGTWWAQKRIAIDELKEVTEQRDRLAATIERLKELPDTWRNECQGNWLRGGVVLQLADDFDALVKGGADE